MVLPPTVEVWNGPLVTASGRPLQRAVIPIYLVAPKNPLLAGGRGEVLSRVTPDTNRNGIWRAELLPMSAYDRQDAYYIADERKWGGQAWAFRVPEDTGPHHLPSLLITRPPGGDPAETSLLLDGLADVEAPAVAEGYLRRDPDGIVRAASGAVLVEALVAPAVAAHRADPEPHPAYDGMDDLVLLYENRLI